MAKERGRFPGYVPKSELEREVLDLCDYFDNHWIKSVFPCLFSKEEPTEEGK